MTGDTGGALVLVPADHDHIVRLAPRLRQIDQIECAGMGRTPEQALRHGLCASAQVWTALVDGEPHAMFGVVVESAASGDAVPWFLGSAKVAQHGRVLVTRGPAIVARMHRNGRTLRNFVSADNRQAIRLLEHWGFTVDHELIVMRGVAFRRFMREIK